MARGWVYVYLLSKSILGVAAIADIGVVGTIISCENKIHEKVDNRCSTFWLRCSTFD